MTGKKSGSLSTSEKNPLPFALGRGFFAPCGSSKRFQHRKVFCFVPQFHCLKPQLRRRNLTCSRTFAMKAASAVGMDLAPHAHDGSRGTQWNLCCVVRVWESCFVGWYGLHGCQQGVGVVNGPPSHGQRKIQLVAVRSGHSMASHVQAIPDPPSSFLPWRPPSGRVASPT
jgi:hypothetical protein